MRIASNKLRSLQSFFISELLDLYSPEEIHTLFMRAAEHYLGWNGTQVMSRLEENLNQSDVLRLYDCAKALAKGKPLQYILGEAWFYDLKLKVNPAVLIPRPETEELVELVLKNYSGTGGRVLDVGTGSGCIPIAIKKHRPQLEVLACDLSKEALALAAENASANNTDVRFFLCDVLNDELPGTFDVIVSNPPYITEGERTDMQQQVLAHEPAMALFAPANKPRIFYEKIIDLCKKHLNKGGKLLFELNPLTAHEVLVYAERSAIFLKTGLLKDMSGKTRFFLGEAK